MNFLFASPSSDDFIHLLKAWKFWLLGAVVGALIGAAIYYLALPPYRARASVNVDFHLEQAWPQDTDREQFYYLERETRKLEEIAWSDAVLNQVASQVNGVTVDQMRNGKLQLINRASAAGISLRTIMIQRLLTRWHRRGHQLLLIKFIQK